MNKLLLVILIVLGFVGYRYSIDITDKVLFLGVIVGGFIGFYK